MKLTNNKVSDDVGNDVTSVSISVDDSNFLNGVLVVLDQTNAKRYMQLTNTNFSGDVRMTSSVPLTQFLNGESVALGDTKRYMKPNNIEVNDDVGSDVIIVIISLEDWYILSGVWIALGQTHAKRNMKQTMLGVTLDQTLSFQQHISNVCRTCYLELRRISTIRHYLSEDATKTLICTFVYV